jgi:methylglutaconyl-CoA hydratase
MRKTYKTLLVEEKDGIHSITMNRPDRRNALNHEMIDELTEALYRAGRCNCGVVTLTGAGTAFCSGLDLEHLKQLGNQLPEEQRADAEAIMTLMRTLYELSKPSIAAVNGAAVAGGTGLATLCDFTLAVPDAKFGYTEAKIGFIPAVVAVFLLRMVGEKVARELLLSGRFFSATEARSMGLVSEVIALEELPSRARALALSLMRNSPESMRSIKELLNGFADSELDRNLAQAIRWSEKIRSTGDFREGVRAFLEKREPVWPSPKSK